MAAASSWNGSSRSLSNEAIASSDSIFHFSIGAEDLFDQILAYRLIDLADSCDRLIAFRPPAYVLCHPNKVLWFIHHIRATL